MVIHTIIKSSSKGSIIHHKGTTEYAGGFISKEGFVGIQVDYYTVKREGKSTKICLTLEEAEKVLNH